MIKLWWALRSLVFVLWLTATVVPWAVLMLLLSTALRGKALYWPTMRWLRMAIWGAKTSSNGREPDELMREVEGWIEAEMRRLDPEAYLPAGSPSGAAQPSQRLGSGGA